MPGNTAPDPTVSVELSGWTRDAELVLTVRLRGADARHAARVARQRGVIPKRTLAQILPPAHLFAFVLPAWIGLLIVAGYWPGANPAQRWGWGVGLLAWGIGGWGALQLWVRRLYDRVIAAQNPTTIAMSPTGITRSLSHRSTSGDTSPATTTGSESYAWPALRGWFETTRVIVLVLPEGRGLLIIPCRDVPDATAAKLLRVLCNERVRSSASPT